MEFVDHLDRLDIRCTISDQFQAALFLRSSEDPWTLHVVKARAGASPIRFGKLLGLAATGVTLDEGNATVAPDTDRG
jgi:hypothetical protein